MRQEARLEALDAAPARRSGLQEPLPGPSAHWFRIGGGHFFLSAGFKDRTSGPVMGEMQTVVVALRWEPIDGQLLGLTLDRGAAEGSRRRIGRIASANRGSHETWRLAAGPEVESWLSEVSPVPPFSGDLAAKAGALHLVELCSCLAGATGASAAELDALARYKGAGGRSIHVGEGAFYWYRTYHLAVADRVVSQGPGGPAAGWRAEGGAYPPAHAVLPGPWRRRAGRAAPLMQDENRRPADSFDPQACYLIEGTGASGLQPAAIDQSRLSLAGLPLARFRPFLARLAPLRPWSLDPGVGQESGPIGLAAPARGEAAGLAAWYRRADLAPLLAWRYSPPLVHGGGSGSG